MDFLLILSAPRSGSTYLRHLLDSHNEIQLEGELFNQNIKHIERHGHFSKKHYQLRCESPIAYVEKYISQERSTDTRFIGFTLFYDQARRKSERCVWDYLKVFPDIKVVHLQRRNYLKNLVSLKLAQRHSKWMSLRGEPERTYSPINLDYTECKNYFLTRKETINSLEDFFYRDSIIDVYYEDLVENKSATLQGLIQHLDVSQQQLQSKTQVQVRQKLPDLIANYHELKSQFANTEWEIFFE